MTGTLHDATLAEARSAAQDLLATSDAVSLSIAVADGERVQWAEGFGYADRSTGTAPTADTLYGIGSASKMLATLAVMRLVDQGKVALDDPYVKYVPTFTMQSPEYRRITVRQLLNHSAGIAGTDGPNLFTFAPYTGYGAQTLASLSHQGLKHAPGYMNIYTNDGFTLVEPLVLAVTGRTFARYVQEEIFTPLGMTHSVVPTTPLAPGSFARTHVGPVATTQEFTNAYASGGIYSTPSDMGRLAAMFIGAGAYGPARIVSEASVNAMAADQGVETFNPVPPPFRWGLGWDTVAEPGFDVVGIPAWYKSGGTRMYTTAFVVLPGERLAVTAIAAGHGAADKPGADPLAVAERILLRELVERKRIAAMPTPMTEVSPVAATVPPEAIAGMTGTWAKASSLRRIAAGPGSSLTLQVWTGTAWKSEVEGLTLRQDGWWISDAKPGIAWSAVAAGGRKFLAQRVPFGAGHFRIQILAGEGVSPAGPLSATWESRLGRSWLIVNERPADIGSSLNDSRPRVMLRGVDGLGGLLSVSQEAGGSGETTTSLVDPSSSEVVARMFLLDRDESDFRIEPRPGEEWAWYDGYVLRPQETVPVIARGQSVTVVVGAEGFAEWRAVVPGVTASQVTIGTAGAWKSFSPALDLQQQGTGSTTVTFPAGSSPSYVKIYGAAGDSVTVAVAP
ncbi:MAG: serine hydrolase domain-containing protein [Deltaproteobacteria bacterium]